MVIQIKMVLDMLTAVERGTYAIIKVKCCVYIPDLSDNVSATLDVIKNQVNMRHCKSSAKGKVHSITGLPQETRKKSNK